MGIGSQRYTGEVARRRMAEGKCPECGQPGNDHTGWGLGRCSLTDTGVAQRIDQYQRDEAAKCTECGVACDEYNSTECDGCYKPVCTECKQDCMASSFGGCPACHHAACPSAECIEA